MKPSTRKLRLLVPLAIFLAQGGCWPLPIVDHFPNSSRFSLTNASDQAINAEVLMHTSGASAMSWVSLVPGASVQFDSSAWTDFKEHDIDVDLWIGPSTGGAPAGAKTELRVPTDQMNGRHDYRLTIEDGRVIATESEPADRSTPSPAR